MKPYIFLLSTVSLFLQLSLTGQTADNPFEGISGTLTDQSLYKTLHCGQAYIYFTSFETTSSVHADKAAFISELQSQGKTKIMKAGFSCAECDDPGAAGCDLTMQLLYESDLGVTEVKENDQYRYTLEAQDVGFRVSCTWCDADQKETPDTPAAGTGATPSAPAAGDHHTVEQQTRCEEKGYFFTALEGMRFTSGTVDDAYEALKKMLQQHHARIGFGCKLCPDATRRCEVRVDHVHHDPGVNTLGYVALVMDSSGTGITIPSQKVIITYQCLDCPEKEEPVNATGDDDQDAIQDYADTISFPWSVIELTDPKMKPFFVPVDIPVKSGTGTVPILAGVVSLGTLAYVILTDGEGEPGCEFNAATQTVPSTCGLSNGSVTISMLPAGDFTYIWSDGSTGPALLNVPAGMYAVTISRTGTTCTLALTAQVGNTNPDFNAEIVTTPSDCGLNNGTAEASLFPAAVYTYNWSNGATTPGITGLSPGSYTLTVSAGGTCVETFSTQITESVFDPVISVSSTPSGCGAQDGTATVSVEPPGDYTYTWSNGQTGQQIKGLAAGSYQVTVSISGSSCAKEAGVTLDELPPSFTLTTSTTPSGCGLTDGTASVSVDPVGDYTYTWSNGQTGPQATGLAAGSYQVTVSITGTNCSQETGVTIDELPPSFTLTTSTTPSGCGLTDGTASVSVDPAGDYTYTWSNGQTGPQATGLAAGSYQVTVSITGTNCSQETGVTIDELPPSFTLTTSTTPSGCGLTDGTASVSVDPAGDYTYTWSNGQTGPQATGLAAGSYQVTVAITGTNCAQETGVTIDELPPSFTLTTSTTPSGCGLTDGTASVSVDPAGDYTYTWSNGQTGPQATGLAAGSYQVTVSITGTNCAQETGVTIDELPPSFTLTTSTTPSGCGLTDGTASVSVDPAGDYTYTWSNGQIGPQATGLAAGSYQVTVSITGTNCAQETSVTIDELPPSFTMSFSTTPAGCGIPSGSATVTIDPPGAYTYAWSNGATDPMIQNVSAGDYTVTVTITGTSCTTTGTVTVGQAGGGFTASFTVDDADCGVANGMASTVIDPPGDYTYLWSDGSTGSVLQNAAPGSYMLTVTDMNACTESFQVTIAENPPDYFMAGTVTPGTCIGGGEVMFTLTTPGSGPMQVDISGPDGTVSFSLAPGSYVLSSFVIVASGTYTFTIIDQGIGTACTQTAIVVVPDSTPVPLAVNDFYQTPGGVPVTGNVLDNDNGLSLEVTGISNVFGGMVTFETSGDFEFTPDPGFSGDASFTYTVTDACGSTTTAVVTILVEAAICDFEADFTTLPASCGYNDGAMTVMVSDPGTYTYIWSNGESGPTITNVEAGTYAVTITDVNLGCDLVFSEILTENPAEYISNVMVSQPTCSMAGEIQFVGTSPTNSDLLMTVVTDNGTFMFSFAQGTVFLSDFMQIFPGEYAIEVLDPEIGTGCFETIQVTLDPPPSVTIVEEAVFPPSEPTAMDGVAIIVATVQGVLPYTVLVNGVSTGTANDHTVVIEGLGVGDYIIQLIDAAGCMSNMLPVTIPFPDIILEFGSGITGAELPASTPEHPAGWQWNRYLFMTLRYPVGRTMLESRLSYLPGGQRPISTSGLSRLTFEHTGRIKQIQINDTYIRLQAGIGMHHFPIPSIHTPSFVPFMTAQLSARHSFGRALQIQASLSLRGGERWEKPEVAIAALMPFHLSLRSKSGL